MDQIFVLSNGKISENGTYDELLDHAGPFAEFLENVKNQTDDFQNESKYHGIMNLCVLLKWYETPPYCDIFPSK